MHDPIALLGDAAADPAQQKLVLAMEQQAAALARVRVAVADALATVPTMTYGGWRGLASMAFDAALCALRSDLAAALSSVDSAYSDTRQAIATVDGRM